MKKWLPRRHRHFYLALQASVFLIEVSVTRVVLEHLHWPLYLIGCVALHLFIDLFYVRFMPIPANLKEMVERMPAGVPTPLKTWFVESSSEEVEHMEAFAKDAPVHDVDLNVQYRYARGIALHYRKRIVDTIYATALDLPSTFFSSQDLYFETQVGLHTISRESFKTYARFEAVNLGLTLAQGANTQPTRVGVKPSEKARIVVIDQATLTMELQQPQFWDFVDWHVTHGFGLKFFVSDAVAVRYEKLLELATGLDSKKTIDDFIVYGTQCVFGRVSSGPRKGRVTLGLHHVPDDKDEPSSIVATYRKFFSFLWRDEKEPHPWAEVSDAQTHSLSELWIEFPALRPTFALNASRLSMVAANLAKASK
jgi:hypothetical protein